jgi:hypothetical protein
MKVFMSKEVKYTITSPFKIEGEWFLPSAPSQKLNGILSFNPNQGGQLELFGSFDDLGSSLNYTNNTQKKLIIGLTNNSQPITLVNSFMVDFRGSINFVGESGPKMTLYKVNLILMGTHVEKIEDLKFDVISSEIFNLHEWIGKSGLKVNQQYQNEKDNETVKVNFKLPAPIEFKIDDESKGEFVFHFNKSHLKRFQKSFSINQRVYYRVTSQKEKSIEGLLSYVFRFQNFLLLALYRSTVPITIQLWGEKHKETNPDGETVRKGVKIFFPLSNRHIPEKPKQKNSMLFNFDHFGDDFEDFIKKWYSMYSLLEPSFNLVFGQFYSGNSFTSNIFLNLVQAAESFHTRIHDRPKYSKEDFNRMKKEILESVPFKYQELLNSQLGFANRLDLHTRLEELMNKYSNKIIDRLIDDKDQFIINIKHSRNYYTHYSGDSRKKALKDKDLLMLSEKLNLLMVCAFLEEVGFTKEKLEQLLKGKEWLLFNHIIEYNKKSDDS